VTDVTYHKTDKGMVYKAMTPKAMEEMGRHMGGPWQMAGDIFWHAKHDHHDAMLKILEARSLTVGDATAKPSPDTTPKPKVDLSKYMEI
jgi:hypothetical protein